MGATGLVGRNALQEALEDGLVKERELRHLLELDRGRRDAYQNTIQGSHNTIINRAHIKTYNA